MVHDAIELGITIQLLEGASVLNIILRLIAYMTQVYAQVQAAFNIVMKHNLTSDKKSISDDYLFNISLFIYALCAVRNQMANFQSQATT